MINRSILATSLLGLMGISQLTIAEGMVNFSIGYEQTSGDYGTESNTDIVTVPLNLQYTNDAWRMKLSVPFISVTGDGSVIPGTSGGITGILPFPGMGSTTSTTLVETESGLGDIITSLSYAFDVEAGSFIFTELSADVKWGTASAKKYLGTGENDYSLSLYTVYEKYDLKPFLSVGYLVMGDTDQTDFNDAGFTTVGLMSQLNENTLLSVAYDYQQAIVNGAEDSKTISLYLAKRVSQNWTANAYILSGLTNSVADSGFGLTLNRNF